MRIAQDNYACNRCGYKTAIKARMRRHLYCLKKICPGSKNDIELTEEIKEKILANRIYHMPKPVEIARLNRLKIKEEALLITLNNKEEELLSKLKHNFGFIYLNYTRACKNADEFVYKFGKSHDIDQRENNYVKGYSMLFVVAVKDRHKCERLVREYFKIEFIPRRDYGYEYFEGDIFAMVQAIKKILSNYITDTIVEFEHLVN